MLQYGDMLEVVAGILERDGRILICQRTAAQSHPLQWEFPGGKVEAGESAEAAVARELWEELGISAVESEELTRYEFAYPGKTPIRLIFLRVSRWSGEPRNLIFQDMQWVERNRLTTFDFLEGDRDFIGALAG